MVCSFSQESVPLAQHPQKLSWRESIRHGLSASQFGMALGLCGRVSDFVDYQRNIVGTPLAFDGCAATEHGNNTESMARCCYEMILGVKVENGGFFSSSDKLLGASPDGQIRGGSSAAKSGVGVPPSASSNGLRLLEIKCPFRAVYDATKAQYQPFGVPRQYMCQMQGQMFLSGADACDFFVFIQPPHACWCDSDKQQSPTSQRRYGGDPPMCLCLRVHRSNAFWSWAEPKLRLVCEWIQHGLPPTIDRSFEFDTFDYWSISVDPLVVPFVFTSMSVMEDSRRFPLFFGAEGRPGVITPRDVGLFTFFSQHVQEGDVLLLAAAGEEETAASSCTHMLVVAVDFDGGCVVGFPGCCCWDAVADTEAPPSRWPFHSGELHSSVLCVRRGPKADWEADGAVLSRQATVTKLLAHRHFMVERVAGQATKSFDKRFYCVHLLRAEGRKQTRIRCAAAGDEIDVMECCLCEVGIDTQTMLPGDTPSRRPRETSVSGDSVHSGSQVSSQPVWPCYSLNEIIALCLEAEDCRGFLYAPQRGAPIRVRRSFSRKTSSKTEKSESTPQRSTPEDRPHDVCASYWMFVVDMKDLVELSESRHRDGGVVDVDSPDILSVNRCLDHQELLERVRDGDPSLALAIILTSALSQKQQQTVYESLRVPFVCITDTALSWSMIAAMLEKAF